MTALLIGMTCESVLAAEYQTEQDYFQELPVVLSASRLSQPISETPNAMTVIDREMIAASGFRNLSDLFRLVPGMYVGAYNGYTPIVAYHGTFDQYSRRMQVLVDGRSVYLPPFSYVNWEDIPMHIADIERVEVIRGTAAASHGANSSQGVINIITRDASSLHGASVSVLKGNGGMSDIAAHLGNTGENLDYRMTLGYRADDGFDALSLKDHSADHLANLRANYHYDGSNSFELQLGYLEGARGLGIMNRRTDPFRSTKTFSDFQQLTWSHVQQQGDDIRLQYYRIHRDFSDVGSDQKLPENTVADRHDLELQHTMQLGASNRLVWGAGVRSDRADSPANLTVPQSLRQSRLFAHDEWRMTQSTLLNVGAMYEKDGMGHSNTSPRVALNYHLTPQHTLRASTSVAYRNPAIMEEKGLGTTLTILPLIYRSAGGLRPEKTLSKEIGYLGEFNAIGVTLDARAYIDQVSDIIFVDPTTLVFGGRPYSFRNLMSETYRGLEGTVKYRWSEQSGLTFNYAHQQASCTLTGILTQPAFLPTVQNNYLNVCPMSVPSDSGSILITQQVMHDIQLSAGYYHQEKMQVVDAQQLQPLMRRVDLRVAKSFGKPGKIGGGELELVLQNMLQDNYREYTSVPSTNYPTNPAAYRYPVLFSRRAYLAVTINF
jgi:iron complex outermembrane receptor protein